MVPSARIGLVAGCLLALVSGCLEAPDYGRRGSAADALALTPDVHPGWLQADCRDCHVLADLHTGYYTVEQCGFCHGGNGGQLLDDDHEGWGRTSCAEDGCHDPIDPHGGAYSEASCVLCHGTNGGVLELPSDIPPEPKKEDHSGWMSATCEACHPTAAIHRGEESPTSCAGCHGSNGGQPRPANHWVELCNDCHADGPYAWNAISHAGLEASAPRACLYCHR